MHLGGILYPPANTKGYIYFPNPENKEVKESGKDIIHAVGVKFLRNEKGCSVYEAGSGSYSFSMD